MAYDQKAANKLYYQRNKDKVKAQVKAYREANREKSRAASNRRNKERWQEIKLAVLQEFGGKCECCGEEGLEFLTVDHINNDGNTHRKEMNFAFGGIYGWLVKHGFPKEGLQLLCWNCNMAKRANGGVCPHQRPEGPTTIAQASTPKRVEARSLSKESEDIV